MKFESLTYVYLASTTVTLLAKKAIEMSVK